jgi:hypothetical protein
LTGGCWIDSQSERCFKGPEFNGAFYFGGHSVAALGAFGDCF